MRQRKVILGISVLAVFIFIVSVISVYVQSLITTHDICGCPIPVYMFIPLLSSLGVFVGTLTYYLMGEKIERTEKSIRSSIEKTLIFLPKDEREVLKSVIESGGSINQSMIPKKTGMSKVKVHRVISRLERRGVMEKR